VGLGSPFRWLGRRALDIAYVHHIKAGADLVRANWARYKRRACPKCHKGVLHPFTQVIDGAAKDFIGCEVCDYFEVANLAADPAALEALRERATFDNAQMQRFKWVSRWMYAGSCLLVAAAVVSILLDQSGLLTANLCILGLFLLGQGAAASYRYWQLESHQLYVLGSFKTWLKDGSWIV